VTENIHKLAKSRGTEDDFGIRLPAHFRCASHTLSLLGTKDLQKVPSAAFARQSKAAFAKSSRLWNLLSRSSSKAKETCQNVLGAQLPTPVVTRWNSIFDCVVALLKHKAKINVLCERLSLPVFKTQDLEFFEDYVRCLAPVATALDKLQGEKNCYYGMLLPVLYQVRRSLLLAEEELQRDTCKPLARHLQERLDYRFKRILDFNTATGVHALTAAVSHPFFRLRWLPQGSAERTTAKEHFVKAVLKKKESMKAAGAPVTLQRQSADDFFVFDEDCAPSQASSVDTMELVALTYLEEPCTDVTKSKLNGLSAIGQVFIETNVPLPSSAPVERLFSYAGMVLGKRRLSLADSVFEELALCKANSVFAQAEQNAL
jgi:hypothetical protein